MKKIILTILMICFSLPAFAAEQKQSVYDRVMKTGILRCGYEAWPPYFSLDPNTKQLTGLDKDLVDIAGRILGLKIEYVDVTLGQDVQDLNSEKIDAMCGTGPWILSSIKYEDYTRPYSYLPEYVYGRIDEKRFARLEDMNAPAVTFAAIDGDVSTDLAIADFPKAKLNSLSSVTDSSQMLLNVTTRKVDAVVLDPAAVSVFEKNNPGQVKILFKRPIAVYGKGFAVKKGEASLLNTLNGAVDALINTGQVDPVLRKYDPAGTLYLSVANPYQAK